MAFSQRGAGFRPGLAAGAELVGPGGARRYSPALSGRAAAAALEYPESAAAHVSQAATAPWSASYSPTPGAWDHASSVLCAAP